MEIVDLDDRRRKRHKIGSYACGECGFEMWALWTDNRVTCCNCGAMAADLFVTSPLKEPPPSEHS